MPNAVPSNLYDVVVGHILHALRLHHGVSQNVLAAAVDISPTTLGRYELGQSVSVHTLYALATCMGTTPAEILVCVDDTLTLFRTRAANDLGLPSTTAWTALTLGLGRGGLDSLLRYCVHVTMRTRSIGAPESALAAAPVILDRAAKGKGGMGADPATEPIAEEAEAEEPAASGGEEEEAAHEASAPPATDAHAPVEPGSPPPSATDLFADDPPAPAPVRVTLFDVD